MPTKFNILVFIAALILLCVFVFILPPDGDASKYENRSMAGLPHLSGDEIISGKYFNNLEAYLTDNIAFRTRFLAFSSTVENVYGLRMGGATKVAFDDNDLGIVMIPNPEVKYVDPFMADTTGTANGSAGPAGNGANPENGAAWQANGSVGSAEQPNSSAEQTSGVIGQANGSANAAGQAGGVADHGDSIGSANTGSPAPGSTSRRHVNLSEPFSVDIHYNPDAVVYGDFYVDTSSVLRYIEILNSFCLDLPETARVFCLLTPTKIEFMDEKYKANSAKQDSTIQNIYEKLDPNIITVDTYSWIAARAATEYLYFRTDHHWTALGAYYAYRAFADTAGIVPITIDNYVEYSIPNYIGSYGAGIQDKVILDNPDTLYYYQLDNGAAFTQNLFFIPEDKSNLSYMVFMGGDHALIDFSSSNKNGKMLIVIKDSYANAFIPWVAPNYERIIVIDPRQYEGSIKKYLGETPDADILFLNSAFTPSLPAFVEKIAEIK